MFQTFRTAKGIKTDGTPCSLKTVGYVCKFHCTKVVPPSSGEVGESAGD